MYQVGQKVKTPAGNFDDVIVIDESNRKTVGAHHLRSYARGTGVVHVGWRGKKTDQIEMTLVKADKISAAEMAKMGYRLAASSGTAFAAMVKAVRQSYECLAQDTMDPFLGPGGAEKEMKAAHKVTGLDRLLEIERRTMKGA